MFFAALGLAPACGGAITDDGGTTGTGSGGTAKAFACTDPQPVIDATSGFVRCANGIVHRATKSTCPSSMPPPPDDAGSSIGTSLAGCTTHADCPPKSYCPANDPLPGVYCRPGCFTDSDCEDRQISCLRRADGHMHHRDLHGRRRMRTGPPLRVLQCFARLPDYRVRLPETDGPMRCRLRLPWHPAVHDGARSPRLRGAQLRDGAAISDGGRGSRRAAQPRSDWIANEGTPEILHLGASGRSASGGRLGEDRPDGTRVDGRLRALHAAPHESSARRPNWWSARTPRSPTKRCTPGWPSHRQSLRGQGHRSERARHRRRVCVLADGRTSSSRPSAKVASAKPSPRSRQPRLSSTRRTPR